MMLYRYISIKQVSSDASWNKGFHEKTSLREYYIYHYIILQIKALKTFGGKEICLRKLLNPMFTYLV